MQLTLTKNREVKEVMHVAMREYDPRPTPTTFLSAETSPPRVYGRRFVRVFRWLLAVARCVDTGSCWSRSRRYTKTLARSQTWTTNVLCVASIAASSLLHRREERKTTISERRMLKAEIHLGLNIECGVYDGHQSYLPSAEAFKLQVLLSCSFQFTMHLAESTKTLLPWKVNKSRS